MYSSDLTTSYPCFTTPRRTLTLQRHDLSSDMMADPFEVRLRFTDMLSSMPASNTSSQKVAQYLLKNKPLSEDLHSCIIEQIDQINDMNVRANILCFIEVFLDAAAKDPQAHDYISMMQRDIAHIVKAVTPISALGQINLTITRLVMQNLERKRHIPPDICSEISSWLARLDSAVAAGTDPLDLPLAAPPDGSSGNLHIEPFTAPPSTSSMGGTYLNDPWATRMGRRQVEKRMEEDRERHKRLRESIWAVAAGPGDKEEWEKIWEETSDLGEDDYRLAKEEAAEREGVLAEYCEHWREKIERRRAEAPKSEEPVDVEMVV